jgi:response regulator
MKMERILVVDDEPITRMDISEILKEANCNVVGEAKDGYEAIEKCEQYKPDFVIMDVKMPLLDGLKAAKVINEKKLSRGVVLLTAYSNKEFIEEAKKIGIIGYIIKPIDEKSFIPNLEIIFSKQEEFEKLEKKYLKTAQKLEDRRKIDIAKSILMRNQNLSENEAYEYIRNLSMNKRTDMGKIADIIILTGENND